MMLRSPRLPVRAAGLLLALPASVALAACTNSKPPPQALVSATLGAAHDSMNNNLCNEHSTRTVMEIGTETGTDPVRVRDGDSQMGSATVNVQCTVSGGYDVSLSASLGGLQGGSITIAGHVSSSGGSGVQGTMNTTMGGNFNQDDCTVVFTYQGADVPQMPPIAPGRIWAHLSCPNMVNTDGHVVQLMNGMQATETCDGEVDFIFENCS